MKLPITFYLLGLAVMVFYIGGGVLCREGCASAGWSAYLVGSLTYVAAGIEAYNAGKQKGREV